MVSRSDHPLKKRVACFLVPSVLLAILSSGSCDKTLKDDTVQKTGNGIITGVDGRACPCCGGLMINFTDEPRPYTGTFFLIDNAIAAYGITDTTMFPVKVTVDYTVLEKCAGSYIKIEKLTRR